MPQKRVAEVLAEELPELGKEAFREFLRSLSLSANDVLEAIDRGGKEELLLLFRDRLREDAARRSRRQQIRRDLGC